MLGLGGSGRPKYDDNQQSKQTSFNHFLKPKYTARIVNAFFCERSSHLTVIHNPKKTVDKISRDPGYLTLPPPHPSPPSKEKKGERKRKRERQRLLAGLANPVTLIRSADDAPGKKPDSLVLDSVLLTYS